MTCCILSAAEALSIRGIAREIGDAKFAIEPIPLSGWASYAVPVEVMSSGPSQANVDQLAVLQAATQRQVSSNEWVSINDDSFDVFLVAGQSNCLNGASLDASFDSSGGVVFQWGRYGAAANRIVDGSEPLQHADYRPTKIGFAVDFGRRYFAAVGRRPLLVPCAYGGTGFSGSRWNPGNDLYADAITRTNAAIASKPGNSLKGVLWHQGETDALAGVSEPSYAAFLDAMIIAMRSALTGGSAVPIVVGGMVPAWVGTNPARVAVQTAIRDTPFRLSKVWYADPVEPSELTGAAGDIIHYSAASLRSFGGRYFDAWCIAAA